jgi:hypothetical protein
MNKQRKYIFTAPANHSTGGPECIHRLCHKLINDHDIDASIYYLPPGTKDPVHKNYKALNVPYVSTIEDIQNTTIVVSDFYPHMTIAQEYKYVDVWIWWLSIDFFYVSYFQEKANSLLIFINRLKHKFKKIASNILPEVVDHNDYIADAMRNPLNIDLLEISTISRASKNLAQSEYAKVFLKEKGVASEYLPDLSDPSFFNIIFDKKRKENIVLYNPAKGLLFTRKIISQAKDIKFIPIQNMSRVEMIEMMKIAKVYIDFGSHPGRDRMPREAAMCGCIVITSLRGSAAFNNDVHIPEKYKFYDTSHNIPAIIKCIRNSIENYENMCKEFDKYREFITTTDKIVDECIIKIFK